MRRAYNSQIKRGINNNPSAALTVALSLALLLFLPPYANSANDTKRLPTDFPPAYAQLEFDEFASIKNLEDLLEERRFRVEMIVFTRSDQTRLGEEPLLFIEPRTLPKSIFALTPSFSATQGGLYAKTNRYCIGYPVIAIEPQLPEKLRALLNKENEPELAQWHKNSSLQKRLNAAPSQFNTQLDEDFLLPKNPRMGDNIDIDIPIDTKFNSSELRQRDFAVRDELLTSADFDGSAEKLTTEPMKEMAIPRSPPQVSLSPYLNFINQLSLFDNNVKKDAYRASHPEDFELGKEASILDRNPKFNLMLHESWQQVVPPRGAPQQIYFTAENSANSLQGLVSVTLGRYLHFSGQLWLEAPVADYETEQLLSGRDAKKVTPQSGLEQVLVKVESFAQALNDGTLAVLEKADLVKVPNSAYFELNESRRMRSKELHYLDHPAMGIIVKITPVEASEELAAAWMDFEEYRKADEQRP